MSGARRRQALGQHFLVDAEVAGRIVEAVGATGADLVCEIGAGPGVLTHALAARAGRLLALELDPRLQAALARAARSWPEAGRVEVRLADARRFPYATLPALRPDPGGRVLVVGNLPYSASKVILERLLEARAHVDVVTVMLQLEVARRLVAPPGGREYGVLSVLWQLWTDPALLLEVSPSAFRPPPAVESAVVQAVTRAAPRVPIGDLPRFTRVVKAAFAQRRKTLTNALRGAGWRDLAAALARAGIDGGRRGETLSIAEFARLAECLGAVGPPHGGAGGVL